MSRKADYAFYQIQNSFHRACDIVFAKGDGPYSEFNLINGEKILVSKNLKHYEDILTVNPKFIRISEQSIINKDFILEITKGGGYQVVVKLK